MIFLDSPEWDDLRERRRGHRRSTRLRRAIAPTSTSTTRSTSSTRAARPGSRRAPRSRTTTSSTTASSSARAAATPTRDRVCIPVPFYHCFGMVLGNLACTTHGAAIVIPEAAFEPGAVLETVEAERCTCLYGVPTMFIAELDHPEFDQLRPVVAAHRDHGRLAVPGRGDEAGRRRDAHGRGDDLLRHDRDVAGVDADRRATTRSTSASSTVGRVHPHVEVKIVDPLTEPHRSARRGRRAAARAATRVMLGYWNDPERTAEAIDAAAVDAHRRPRDDGRRGLRQHRRPDQGHGHPRRRERVPARDRGVPLHAPRRRRRPGDRRARRSATARSSWRGCGCATGATVDEEELRDFCRGRIAHFKVPRYVRSPTTSR